MSRPQQVKTNIAACSKFASCTQFAPSTYAHFDPYRCGSVRSPGFGTIARKPLYVSINVCPETIVRAAHALADRTRFAVWMVLGPHRWSITAIAELLGLSVSTASHHVRELREAGLVHVHRDGRHHLVQRDAERWVAITAALMPPPKKAPCVMVGEAVGSGRP